MIDVCHMCMKNSFNPMSFENTSHWMKRNYYTNEAFFSFTSFNVTLKV